MINFRDLAALSIGAALLGSGVQAAPLDWSAQQTPGAAMHVPSKTILTPISVPDETTRTDMLSGNPGDGFLPTKRISIQEGIRRLNSGHDQKLIQKTKFTHSCPNILAAGSRDHKCRQIMDLMLKRAALAGVSAQQVRDRVIKVPLPATLPLIAAGLGGLALIKGRKGKRRKKTMYCDL